MLQLLSAIEICVFLKIWTHPFNIIEDILASFGAVENFEETENYSCALTPLHRCEMVDVSDIWA